MRENPLGRTGIRVSAISVGTVSLGLDYGIEKPGDFGRPQEPESLRILCHAADSGINLFDTAPAYGTSEGLLGRALGDRAGCIIATKVMMPKDPDHEPLRGARLCDQINKSLHRSRNALRRTTLDIVQIHNATVDLIEEGEMTACLKDAQREGLIRFLGASVYTEEEAMAIIASGSFDTVQVAYNILDQRMARHVFPAAFRAGVGVLVRSALMKGILSRKAEFLPPGMDRLREAAIRARDELAGTWEAMPAIALRFCLAAKGVSSILVGVRNESELVDAIAAEKVGALPDSLVRKARSLAIKDESLLDPTRWLIR